MNSTLYGLGIGPGDPELITLKALRILRDAPILAYPAPETGKSLARQIVSTHLQDGKIEIPIRMPLSAKTFPKETVYDDATEILHNHLSNGQDVAVLCEGDPFFYGSFMYLFARMSERHNVEVIPGVSSPMACAAVLGAPLAAQNDVLTILPAPLTTTKLKKKLAATDAAAIIKLGRHFGRISKLLHDMNLETCSRYIERVTMETERILPLDQVDPRTSPYFSMILVHRRGQAWLR